MEYDGYDGSNAIRIVLKTDIDFTSESPSVVEILYKKPDESTGTWTGAVLSGSESEGKIYYDMTTSDELTAGLWYVKAKLTYSDSRVIYTQWAILNVGD